MSEEKFSLSKFLTSFIQPLGWVKSLSLGLKIFIIIFTAFTIWKAYFTKTQTQHNQITVGQGGTVNVSQGDKKRAWWIPTPFVDMYAFVESDDRSGVGGRAGCRWEF